jgi:hypothetical protein
MADVRDLGNSWQHFRYYKFARNSGHEISSLAEPRVVDEQSFVPKSSYPLLRRKEIQQSGKRLSNNAKRDPKHAVPNDPATVGLSP